jgi:tetraacyldisaccharide 4'-kinase
VTERTLSLLFAFGRPFSPFYARLMRLRERAYATGRLASLRLPCPVVSIGNLSLGGTGKTPHVQAMVRWLRERGKRPVVVSRGYGGTVGRGPAVVSDGERVLLSPREAGDEPVMIAHFLRGVPVIVGSDRFSAGVCAVEKLGADVIVLDDGFQHLRLAREVDLVLLPANGPFSKERVFPGGDLREPVSALSRATAVLLTRAEAVPAGERELVRHRVQTTVPGVPVFFSETRVTGMRSVGGRCEGPGYLKGAAVLAFCALGDPQAFWDTLERLGADVKGREAFPDHYFYKAADLARLLALARATGAQALVTTAKDVVKIEPLSIDLTLRGRDASLPVWVLEIEAMPERGLWNLLGSRLHVGSMGAVRSNGPESL